MKRSKAARYVSLLLFACVIALMLSACSGDKEENSATGSPPASQAPASNEGAGTDTGEAIDPLGKYEPAIQLSISRADEGFKFEPGQSIDKNLVYDFYESDLGVKLTNEWVVPQDQYEGKVNVAISSGSIPDLVLVNGTQLKSLIEAGMIEDLTEVIGKYASEATRKKLDSDGGLALNAASVDGKIYAVPAMTQGYLESSMIWVRQDWLDKLGLQPPKTIDDVINIATAFAKNDPDGNNVDDTYGLGLSKELQANLFGFMNSYHAYPGKWIQGGSGTAVYGSIQPEMKAPLLKLAELYKNGIIDKEFGVKDVSKMKEAIVAGKLGLFYNMFAAPFDGIKDLIVNDPDAVLNAYPITSFDNAPAKAYLGPTAINYWVVKKGYKNPEVVVKLANFYQEHWLVHPKLKYSTNQETGIMYYPYTIVGFDSPMAHIIEHDAVKAAFDAQIQPDEKSMTANVFGYLRGLYRYTENRKNTKDPEIATSWIYYQTFGTPHSGTAVLKHYFDNNLLTPTALKVSSTPTMAEKMATLLKMENVMMTKIILGEAGIEEFDKYVANWKKQGGDQITQEVNE
ncbi:extracellular solute-binding protein [Paenibacillus eucommiae]|uniref:Aldouronate transport system substrate-binding protein n=1 Tax=Paenibacillus eucommiae TaxID=1355755 RepID=A0ABS4J385_9BACL|nr:extracellular solute-binding protein [Paenibacillus eucommiae]MBP1994260.1 putative aldouronate transport system substrate-binding protein [Paenibacillus eucommiae]